MTNVILYRNGISLTDFDTFIEVANVGDLLMRELNGVWPETAKIYHNKISQSHDVTPIYKDQASVDYLLSLEGTLYVVVHPEAFIPILVWVAIALSVVAIGLAFLLRPSTQGQSEGSPNNELSDRQNKPRPNERIPDIFGTVRSTPDLVVYPYKTFKGGAEFEQAYMVASKGYLDVLDCKDGTTPVEDIAGEFVAVYDPFTGPNASNNTPSISFGTLPTTIDPIVCVQPCTAVNGQLLRAPNSGNVQAADNFAFGTGGIIKTNDSNIDLTQYFTASTIGNDEYLQITTNDAGENADDPGGVHATVGLAGTYKILSVSNDTIVLSHPELVNANWNALAAFTGGMSTYYHTFWIYSIGERWVGPFILEVANLSEVWCNFVVSQGLYYVDNKGRQGALHVTVKVGVQAVDSTGTPVGDEVYGTVNLDGSSLNKNITGSTLKMQLPSQGSCQVRALLITDMATDSRNSYSQSVQWRDLFAVSPVMFNVKLDDLAPNEFAAFSYPTTCSNSPDTSNGNQLAVLDVAGKNTKGSFTQQTSSGGLANWFHSVQFAGFVMPADMPADAVITRIKPMVIMSATGVNGAGSTTRAFGGLATQNFDTPIPDASTSVGIPLPGDTSFEGQYISTSSLGNTAAVVTGGAINVQLFQTSAGSGYNSQEHPTAVAFVIYYTSASHTPSAPMQATYGDFGNVTTVLAVTAQTPDALSVKERKTNLLVTRKLPTWINRTDPGPAQFSTDLYPTNNAADIMCAMALDPFIGRRPLSQLDVAGIYAVADSAHLGGEHVDGEIATYFGTFLMTEFCGTFDDSKVSFEESLAQLAQAINCTSYRSGGSLISLFFEKATTDSKILFNHRNKIPDSETRTVTFGQLNDNDGIEYTYVEPNAPNLPQQDTQLTIYVPADQSAMNAKKVTSFGVRNAIQAQINANRMYAKLNLANTTTEFTALPEANQVLMTQRVLVADNTRQETQDGDCIDVDGTGLIVTTNKELVWVTGHTYTVFLQHYDYSVESIAVTPGPNPLHQFVLATPPALEVIIDPKNRIRTLFIKVDDTEPSVRPLAFLISKKEVSDNGSFKLTAIAYNDGYYEHDTDVINGYLIAPASGYATQGYIGQGLLTPSGSTYVPPPRNSFNTGTYGTSPAYGNNNPAAPVTTPPVFAGTTEPIQVDGVSATAPVVNFSDASPAAPAGAVNVKWQKGTDVDVMPISGYVGPATGASPGMAPALPAVTPLLKFLRGDNTYVVPPLFTGAAPGYAPAFPSDTTKFLRGDGTFARPAITTGTAPFEVDALTASAIAYIAKGYAGPRFIQSAFNNAAISPNPQAMTSNVTAGNLIIVFWYQSIIGGPGCADSQGNAYTQLATATGAFGIVGVTCFAAIASATGPLTVTASGSRPVQWMSVLEYTGVTSITPDIVSAAWHYSPQASPLAATSITTSQADVIVCYYMKDDTSTAIVPPTGMTMRTADPGFNSAVADMNANAGTYNMNWGFTPTPSTNNMATIIIALKGQVQTGDLFQFFDGYSGAKLSSVDAKGHWVNAITSGAPTIAAPTGAQAYDPATGITWVYNGTAWSSGTGNPITTQGDMIVGGSGGVPARLPASTAGYVLTANGPATSPSWQPSAGGGGGGVSGLFGALMNTPPTQASMGLNVAWNQKSSLSVTDVATGVWYNDTTGNGNTEHHQGLWRAYPGVPFTMTMLMSLNPSQAGQTNFGWVIGQSASGKLMCLSLSNTSNSATTGWAVNLYTNYTTYSGTSPVGYAGQWNGAPFVWMRLKDDGTNIIYSVSFNFYNWITIYSVAKSASFVAGNFNFVGIDLNTYGGAQGFVIMYWNYTTP